MSDVNFRSHADEENVRIVGERIEAGYPEAFDDILKLSNVNEATIQDCAINLRGGNREDGVDMMRFSRNVTMTDCRVGAGRKYAFTIKGGCRQISLNRVQLVRHGGGWERVDIDIGNYSATTPDAKTGSVVLRDVSSVDGRPVRVRVGWAEPPVIVGGNVRVLFWQSLGLKLYVWFKRKFLR